MGGAEARDTKGKGYMADKVRASFKELEKAIRLQCVECFGGARSEVEHCTSPKCSLYPYRNGSKLKGGNRNPRGNPKILKNTVPE